MTQQFPPGGNMPQRPNPSQGKAPPPLPPYVPGTAPQPAYPLPYGGGPPGYPPPGGYYPPPPARKPMSLALILLIIFSVLAIPLLISILFPAFGLVRENANRIKCRSNLKQIGLMALSYANSEVRTGGSFPRTYYNPPSSTASTAEPVLDALVGAGGAGFSTPASFSNPPAMSGSATAVGPNDVSASFYLIMKSADMSPDVFLCPSTQNQRPFGPGSSGSVQDCSNWPDVVNDLSYSYNCPFPTLGAVQDGWKWNNSLGMEDPMAADKNPGVGNIMANGSNNGAYPGTGSGQSTSAVTKVQYTDGKRAMSYGNSNNHNNEGQNVLFCDGHVDWLTSPFAGRHRAGLLFQDNIYTADSGGTAPTSDNQSSGGLLGNHAGPGDAADAYLLPTCSSSGY